MSAVLWLSSARYLLHRPWQMALSVLGITLGVAVVVAIDLGNQSAKHAFNLSSSAVTGKATHQIVGGPSGLPEDVYRTLRLDLGARKSAPVVEGYARLDDGKTLQLLGIDPLSDAQFRPYTGSAASPEGSNNRSNSPTNFTTSLLASPNTALISVETAESLELKAGDTLALSIADKMRTVEIVALIAPQNSLSAESLRNLLITDISTAQELLGLEGKLSRIDLIVQQNEHGEQLIERISTSLPPEAALQSSGARSDTIAQLTRSFDQNLFIISLLGLIIGAFLIYNTMTFSIVQRRPIIGSLRALGVTRRQVFAVVLGEALVIGAVSSIIGVLLGILIGRGLVHVITQNINDLFFVVSVQELTIPAWSLAKGALLGILATLAAAFVPALEATGIPPREALSRSHLETRLRSTVPLASVIGVILISVGIALIFLPVNTLIFTFIGLASLIIGCAALTPICLVLVSKSISPVLARMFGALGAAPARGIVSSLSRTAVAIAALAVAISITISIDTMVKSFRTTVEQWLNTSLSSDIYISPASLRLERSGVGLDPAILESISVIDGVESVSTVRNVRVHSPDGEVDLLVVGTTSDRFARYNTFKKGDPALFWDDLRAGDAVAVSEPFANLNDKDVGSLVRLHTAEGARDFRIAGIYYDYNFSASGRVLMSRNAYQRFYDDDNFSGIGITASEGTSPDELIPAIESAIGAGQQIAIRSNADLKAAAMEIFDRSFAITSVVYVLSISVAFIGVLSALMALQMERTLEFGTLRVIGFTPRQVWLMFTSQTALMGVIAGLLSLPLGLIEAAVLIFVVNRRSFGWTMDMEIYPLVLLQAVVIAVAAALLASVYPAFRMSRSSPASVLRRE